MPDEDMSKETEIVTKKEIPTHTAIPLEVWNKFGEVLDNLPVKYGYELVTLLKGSAIAIHIPAKKKVINVT